MSLRRVLAEAVCPARDDSAIAHATCVETADRILSALSSVGYVVVRTGILPETEDRLLAAERELANAVAALAEVRQAVAQVIERDRTNGGHGRFGYVDEVDLGLITAALGPWAFTAGQEHLAGAVEPAPGPDDTAELGRRADQLRKDQP